MINKDDIIKKYIERYGSSDEHKEALTSALKCINAGGWSTEELTLSLQMDLNELEALGGYIDFINEVKE